MDRSDRYDLTSKRKELSRLVEQVRAKAQSVTDSSTPELLDSLDELLRRHEHWQAMAKTATSPEERERLLRIGEDLKKMIRNLPLSYESP
ncbi:hypothetical protein Ga0609869_002045 [Rhodovulum iodosum]|uniref:Uncharacterized protein n=1 Tax=Rhodovulum iodosum TaxID=68291 RepID=A0ABV3XTP0_9RHOB|nr:hypothetical protein [Rhodovulum robiginosum]RSK32136.1 hypothetical protein EJA01_13000 [Rhodovulum robiginosum]